MGEGSVHGKNSEPSHKADRRSTLSGHPGSGPSQVGVPAGLKARISMSPRQGVTRGGSVDLSAKHSTGFIKSYRWSFTYEDGSDNDTIYSLSKAVPPLKVCTKKDVDISIVVLRSLRVTLTVTDTENGPATDEAVITVNQRSWETKFVSRPGVKPMPGIFGHDQGGFSFGLNDCTFEGAPITGGSGHGLHSVKTPKKTVPNPYGIAEPPPPFFLYEDNEVGFAVNQVSDPGGPFHALCYVSSYKVVVDRTLYMNKRLLPSGDLNTINHQVKEIDHVATHYSRSMDTLVRAISTHEQIHSDIMQEILKKSDPATKLENYISEDLDDLREIANGACSEAETALQEDSFHEEEVHRRLRARGFDKSGTIMLGDGSEYDIPSFADVGDKSDSK
jgi:hypothetical protein